LIITSEARWLRREIYVNFSEGDEGQYHETPIDSRAVRHDILQFSARVLAIIASEILSFKEIPIEFSL
jgi:hypothetical protein